MSKNFPGGEFEKNPKLVLAFFCYVLYTNEACAGVMELVDVVDSKSTDGDIVPVRVRPPAPKIGDPRQRVADFTYSLFTIHSSL